MSIGGERVKNGKRVMYVKILKALCGCVESAVLWYKLYSSVLVEMGFEINPYDKSMLEKGKSVVSDRSSICVKRSNGSEYPWPN